VLSRGPEPPDPPTSRVAVRWLGPRRSPRDGGQHDQSAEPLGLLSLWGLGGQLDRAEPGAHVREDMSVNRLMSRSRQAVGARPRPLTERQTIESVGIGQRPMAPRLP
jgi:hypothetical protein